MNLTRREFLGIAGGASAAAALGLVPDPAQGHQNLPRGVKDAITHRTYDAVKSWTNWLQKYGVRGYFCETGWANGQEGPRLYADGTSDIPQWNTLGNKIYSWLDGADVWATAWTAGITSGASILKMYGPADPEAPLADRVIGDAYGQARIVEAHPTTAAYKRGMNASGGELHLGIADDQYSNTNSGVYGQHYVYPRRESLAYLARRGHKLIRLPFLWERVQPSIGGSLSLAEVGRLKTCVADASAEGLKVVLNVHNMGRYHLSGGPSSPSRGVYIGEPELPVSAFQDLWRRLSSQFKGNLGVAGYQLMNEPRTAGGVAQWKLASQAAVNAIRANGDKQRLMVAGYHTRDGLPSGGVHAFVPNHPRPWINDPAKKIFYTTSGYWGHYSYRWLYNRSNRYWKNQGY